MKKWFKFFCLSFFDHKLSKEGEKRGYTNAFLGLLLTFIFIWSGFVGAEMLPFSTRYDLATDLRSTVQSVFANSDVESRINAEIVDGKLILKKGSAEYTESLLINSYESESDREIYGASGYNVIVDTRPADALAEVEAYCLSNDGRNTEISYEDYLTLSEVARLNFDFKLRYTGAELQLDDETVDKYLEYVNGLGEQSRNTAAGLAQDLADRKITKSEYNRSIYQLYFTNYYPSIAEYESSSVVPLLRNYYYHQYLKDGGTKYLLIFDDYMAGSFDTEGGEAISFYGFYGDMADGAVAEGNSADEFIKQAYAAILPLTVYAFAMNVFSLIPFIALMPMVVSLLAYSILKLRGIESIGSLGGAFKIVCSYVWVSGAIAAILSVVCSFFLQPGMLSLLPLLLFFIVLAVRSVAFAITEAKSYTNKSKPQTVHTEA